jgi:hypothetical protein
MTHIVSITPFKEVLGIGSMCNKHDSDYRTEK